jgi:succinoglycan biosynthesis protein ExoO
MRISVLMANYRGAATLPEAMASVLRQSHADLELIVVDDASGDDSAAIVRQAMAADPRVRLIEQPTNAGPSAARNRAVEAATGDWLAIMDSDDILHPARLERMLAAAEALKADAVADDMLFFGETVDASGRTLLGPLALTAPMPVDAALFVEANSGRADLPPLGYLKPLVRRSAWGALRYDPAVRIGEDYDVYLRLLLQGARLFLLPEALYLYRRHSGSISHRLSVAALEPLIAAHDRSAAGLADPALVAAMARRRAGLEKLLAFERLVAAMKARQAGASLGALAARPGLALELARSVRERLQRRAAVSVERTPKTLVLGEGGMDVPPVLPPEQPVTAPPALLLAQLSDLAARHDLAIKAQGEAALHLLWMVPRFASARVTGAEGPLPPGATRD